MTRVLVVSNPLERHLRPMLPLARAARHAGHDVVIATRGAQARTARERGFAVWELAGEPVDAASDLDERAAGWPPDVVVQDPVDLGAPLVAARAGARHAVHSAGPAFSPRLYEIMATRFAPLYGGTAEVLDALRRAVYLDVCPPSLASDDAAWWPRRAAVRPVGPTPADGVTVAMDGPDSPADPEVVAMVEAAVAGLARRPVLVSGGDAGAVLAALARGVPLLLLPEFYDQIRTAGLCARAGAAIVLTPPERDPAAVRAAVERLIAEPGHRAAARRIAAEIAALPSPWDVIADLIGRPA